MNTIEKAGAIMKGFFKAPESGKYRFHLSSDDESALWLDNTWRSFPDASDPSERKFLDDELICIRNVWNPWRRWYNEFPQLSKTNSDFISLHKDQYYPIEGYFFERVAGDHMTVAVEYKPENWWEESTMREQWRAQSHPQASREVQILGMKNLGALE